MLLFFFLARGRRRREKHTWRTLRARRISPRDNLRSASRPSSVRFTLTSQAQSAISLFPPRYPSTIQLGDFYLPFFLHNLIHFDLYFLFWQGRESKPGTSRLDSRGDFVDIVAKDTESHVFSVLFDHWFERI